MAANDDTARTAREDRPRPARGRRAARYAVPVAVAGVAAATVGLVPALAASGDPHLPKISAHDLIEKMAASPTQHLSGNVTITTDLGLPSLPGMGSGSGGGSPFGGASGSPSASAGQGGSAADPDSKLMELASGTHSLHVAVDGAGKQKVSIMEDAAEYSLIRNGGQLWAYDSGSNQAFHTAVPQGRQDGTAPAPSASAMPTTPQQFADQALKAAGDTTSVTVDGTSHVAGRDAYDLVVKPKQSGSTVGSIRIAVDSKTFAPLDFTLAPTGGGKAVVDVGYTKVDFSKPSASTFDFTPPKGTRVTEGKDARQQAPSQGAENPLSALGGSTVIGKGWTSIAELSLPSKAGAGATTAPGSGSQDGQNLLNSLGDKVTGAFGSGTVFHTRLVNALMTDDGKVYVGAVTQQALVDAANNAAK
jgi:outer membrane lipoprotein-sorting protein